MDIERNNLSDIKLGQFFENKLSDLGIGLIPEDLLLKGEKIGMTVYKGTLDGHPIAMKKIKLLQETIDNAVNELQVLTIANIPHLPDLKGVVKSRKGYYYILLELMTGKKLSDCMSALKSDTDKLLIVREICQILECFHLKNILLLDISPNKFYIESDNRLRMVDLGQAKITKDNITYTKRPIKAVEYMAPDYFITSSDESKEANENEADEEEYPHQVSEKCDIWSAGVLISELFSGVKPYSKNNKPINPAVISQSLMMRKPFPVPKILEDDIKDLVARATANEPEDRPTATQMKQLVDNIIKTRCDKM